jgi:hypothetical protein
MGLLVSADKGASWQSAGPAFPFPPAGLAYSTFRNKLFAWQWQCAGNGDPIPADDLAALSITFN